MEALVVAKEHATQHDRIHVQPSLNSAWELVRGWDDISARDGRYTMWCVHL